MEEGVYVNFGITGGHMNSFDDYWSNKHSGDFLRDRQVWGPQILQIRALMEEGVYVNFGITGGHMNSFDDYWSIGQLR